jgi:hypothetical protein
MFVFDPTNRDSFVLVEFIWPAVIEIISLLMFKCLILSQSLITLWVLSLLERPASRSLFDAECGSTPSLRLFRKTKLGYFRQLNEQSLTLGYSAQANWNRVVQLEIKSSDQHI